MYKGTYAKGCSGLEPTPVAVKVIETSSALSKCIQRELRFLKLTRQMPGLVAT